MSFHRGQRVVFVGPDDPELELAQYTLGTVVNPNDVDDEGRPYIEVVFDDLDRSTVWCEPHEIVPYTPALVLPAKTRWSYLVPIHGLQGRDLRVLLP